MKCQSSSRVLLGPTLWHWLLTCTVNTIQRDDGIFSWDHSCISKHILWRSMLTMSFCWQMDVIVPRAQRHVVPWREWSDQPAQQIFCNLLKKKKLKSERTETTFWRCAAGAAWKLHVPKFMKQENKKGDFLILFYFFFYSTCNFIVHVKKKQGTWMVGVRCTDVTGPFKIRHWNFKHVKAAFKGFRLICIIVESLYLYIISQERYIEHEESLLPHSEKNTRLALPVLALSCT